MVSGCCFHGIPSLILYLIFFIGELVAKSCLSYPTLVTPWTVACQAPLSMGFSRQEYWSGLPIPSPGDLLDSGIRWTQVDSCIAGRFLYWLSYERSPIFFFSISLLFYWGKLKKCLPPSLITKIVPSHYSIFKWCWSRYSTVFVSFLIFHVFLNFSSFRHKHVCAVLLSLSLSTSLPFLSVSACIYCIC